MTDNSDTSPTFLSSLPSQPITDDIVKQIGENDNPKIRGAMGFPGSTPGAIEAFLLNMEAKTHVLVFDPTAEQWRVYESFGTEEMDHQEMIDHASDLANEWLAASLSDRITAADETDLER
ncbi:hypothetical protein [Halococcus sp. PRR34]|uniref:hypothetical protein n=1 Tax=Halococcus sp. PRR34 TaxID=3020830 RepID=UPI00235EC5F5|nr:hypothetical protein [Halococcus sp. PRR34]